MIVKTRREREREWRLLKDIEKDESKKREMEEEVGRFKKCNIYIERERDRQRS